VLVAFDYDGTLAPIASDPGRARMRLSTRRLLVEVARLYPCIVISGRSRANVWGWLRGMGVLEVIGNHGAEPSRTARHFAKQVERWQPLLEARLAAHRGVKIENKILSVAVHYRQSREKRKARLAALEAARSLGDVRVIPGKLVVNILPAGAPHKGMALEAARERLGCDTAIYVGDDETDEDVFALQEPGRLLAIRVGPRRESLASYCIRRQAQVDDLLRALIAVRRPSGRRQLAAR
jgi:trehalose 6-phosphate phosphatase